MRNEWKAVAEKLLFFSGKQVLGQNAGGQIVRLIKERGFDGTMNAIMAAADKQDPREYIGAVLREKAPDSIGIGDQMGGYVWNGSRWAEHG